jgi:hypothetical protein
MLLEAFAPNPDVADVYQIEVGAPPDVVYRALWTADFGTSPIIGGLLVLRGLRARGTSVRLHELTLQAMMDAGFGRLAEEPNREIVLGVMGRFWRPTGNVEAFNSGAISQPVPAGMAQGVWNFCVLPQGERVTRLSTETRVTCGDRSSRFKFRLYWLIVRPFSGLIRVIMLRTIRRTAEASAAASERSPAARHAIVSPSHEE